MKMIIIGGFLGSGKTTVIRHLARHLVNRKGEKVVIIENEAGEIGIDDKLLSVDGFQVKEIFAGCVCCQLTAELTLTVNKLRDEFNPQWIILEASGVAKPSTIQDTLKKYGKGIDLMHTLVLVDSGRWHQLYDIISGLLESQVTSAEWVMLNKIDETDPQQLASIEQQVKQINPKAKLYKAIASEELDSAFTKEFEDLA